MSSVDLMRLPVGDFTRLVFHLLVEDNVVEGISRGQARDAVLEALKAKRGSEPLLGALNSTSPNRGAATPAPLTPERIAELRRTWGKLPEHQQGLRNAVRATGGPGALEKEFAAMSRQVPGTGGSR